MARNDDLALIAKALAFAAHKHRDQRRKDRPATPYINHPIALVDILCNEGNIDDTATLCAALLHDTVEDTHTTAAEIEQIFGTLIRDIVMAVTDDKSLPKMIRKQQQIDHAATLSDPAKLVKLADKISNLRDITTCPPSDWNLQRQQTYFDWAKQVIDQLRGVHTTLEAIFDVVYAQRPHH